MRARHVSLFLILLLVVPTAGAQFRHARYQAAEPDASGGLAPLGTLVDASAQVIQSAIREADRDGTPDQAERLIDRMRSFAEGLESAGQWPARATVAGSVADQLAFGNDLTLATEPIPEHVARVARLQVGCEAWRGNATQAERVDWAHRAWPSFNQLAVATASLNQTLETAPEGLSTDRLQRSIDQLDAWRRAKLEPATDCLPPPDFFYVQVHPSQTWPGDRLLVQGGVGQPPENATVHLTAPGLGLDEHVELEPTGGFLLRLRLPTTAELGTHTLTAELAGNTTEAELLLTRAPARLILSTPPNAVQGQPFEIRARVSSPLPDQVGDGPVTFTGNLTGNATLTNTTTTFTALAPDQPGLLRVTATYPGTRLVVPTEARTVIPVVTEAQAAASQAPEQSLEAFSPGDGGPPWTLLATAGGVVLAAALAYLGLTRWRSWHTAPITREPTRFQAPRRDATFQVIAPLRQGVVWLFATVVTWLRARGLVRASLTAREVSAELEGWGIPAEEVALAFEQARYSDQPAGAGTSPEAGVLARFWERVREVLG